MPSMQLPISTLALADSPEGRFLAAADQAGDKNGQISVDELKSYAAAKPEQADLIGKARITDWTTRIGSANPQPTASQARQQTLYTAPLGPDALVLATRYAELLKSAGLKVSDIEAIQRTNFGKVTGARVSYDTAPMNPGVIATARAQEVRVNVFGDAISQTGAILASLQVANAVVLDIQITATYNIGTIAAMRISYCTRQDYDRNTTG